MNNNSVQQLLMQALLGFIPNHFNAATALIGAVVHSVGAGLSNLTSGGVFTDIADHVYTIKITATNKFQWKKDGGAYNGSDVTITGSAQNLSEGVTITFGATTGYTLNDQFTISVKAGTHITSAKGLGNIAINSVGNGAVLAIYDGQDSTGTLLYKSATANWTAGQLAQLGYLLQGGNGLYVALYAATTYPDLIVGTR